MLIYFTITIMGNKKYHYKMNIYFLMSVNNIQNQIYQDTNQNLLKLQNHTRTILEPIAQEINIIRIFTTFQIFLNFFLIVLYLIGENGRYSESEQVKKVIRQR